MAVSFKSSSNTGNDVSVTSISPAVPSSTAAGDVIIAVLTRWETFPASAVTIPSGFTEFGSQIIGGGANMNTYWKWLTGTDSGAYTFSWDDAMWSHVHVFCFSGVKSSGDPVGSNYDSWTGTAGTYGTTQVTTAFAPGLIWSGYNDSSGTHTPPTNFTEVADFDSGAAAYYVPGTSGTFSAANASVSSSSNALAILIALEPEPTAITASVWGFTA